MMSKFEYSRNEMKNMAYKSIISTLIYTLYLMNIQCAVKIVWRK